MRYAAVFALLSGLCALSGIAAAEATRGLSLAFLWPAVSFTLLTVAYAGGGPKWLGKRSGGGRGWVFRWLLAPYLLLTRFSFLLYKLLGRRAAVCEVVPNLYLGRRLNATEASRFTDVAVLDLAAEFSETRPFRQAGRYLSLPVLDATAATAEQLSVAVQWIAEHLSNRPVFVHCALGHGRSASVVIAYLLTVSKVHNVRDGLRHLRQLRPGVGLSAGQRRALERWHTARNPVGGA